MFIVQAVVLRHTIMAAEAAVEAIHEAMREGNAEAVARMLDEDPRLLSSTAYGDTLLTRAAATSHVGMVQLLLERGADVNASTYGGTPALHRAAYYGHEEVVSTLLSSGADVYRRSVGGDTALMKASWSGHVAVVRLLLRSMGGCGLDWRNRQEFTVLYLACYHGHADIVRALLLAGADHTIAAGYGMTPQQIAQNRGHRECTALIQVSFLSSVMSNSQTCVDTKAKLICGACTYVDLCVLSIDVISYSLCLWQWWEGELARAYVLHKARTLHDDTATHQQAPAARVPAYLRTRVQGSLMPLVQVVTRQHDGQEGAANRGMDDRGQQKEEEEVGAMVGFVVKDLAAELYTELLAGLHQ
jgi:ankyrin repeat protein